jgi:hypothetical protein
MSTRSASSLFGYKPSYTQVTLAGIAETVPGCNLQNFVVTTVTNAGTLTAAQVVGGVVNHAGTSGNLTLPSAASILNAMPGASVGAAFDLHVRNSGNATSTLVAGTNVTISGTAATATLNSKIWRILVTDNRIGSEAVTAWSLGTSVF